MWKDEELVEAVARGEEFALEILFEKHYEPLFKYTLVILKNRDDAKEVVNETFFRTFRYARNFRGGSFSSWLFKIAKNLSIDYLNKRNKDIQSVAEIPELCKGESFAGFKEKITEEMENLKPEYREILLLKDFAGYSIKEIAEITGKNPSAVKTMHHRAIKSLREKLIDVKGER